MSRGLLIGHAGDLAARTGCTVLLGPFRAACELRGHAMGTRQFDALSPFHVVDRVDALLLTGGSAFGLHAAEGVVQWLAERGRGFDTRVARVPIVPGAVIYDLGVGRSDVRPDPAMGRAACDAAVADNPAEGRVGAGMGATVGKLLGPERAMHGGLGRFRARSGSDEVLALAVVNAVGDVRDGGGRIIAGARNADGTFADAARVVREASEPLAFAAPPAPGTSTTLAVVATDAPLDRVALHALARMAGAALAHRITPVFTPFDGDIVIALSTAPAAREATPADLLRIGTTATWALENAIERAVLDSHMESS
jgi:L-aminopeptidase/D-esterase-like protein